jgi:hypothetical protein
MPLKWPSTPRTAEDELRELMSAANASSYAVTLIEIVRPVLTKHPSDEFGVVATLNDAIERLARVVEQYTKGRG